MTGHNKHLYLDDIIIQGIDLIDNIDNFERVFTRFQESKLKVNLKKYTFFKTSVRYLGHIISAEGPKPQRNKIEIVNKMTNYYRKFIQCYAGIAAP